MDDSPKAKQKRLQNRMENGLINAIKAGSIEMKAGDWIEIDAQADYNSKNNGYTTNMNANYRPDGDASDHLWTWTGK